MNLKRWMEHIPNDRNLFSLNIPGTHDCVTQHINLSHFTRCQDRNITGQLELGVRALDIRVKSNGDKLTMVHGIFSAYNEAYKPFRKPMDMNDVLYKVYKYLEKNPSETIIFMFKNDSKKEEEKCFDNLFHTYILKNKEKWYLDNRIPIIGEVRGKIVLVRRCNMNEKNPSYTDDSTGINFSSWVEQDKAIPKPLKLKTGSKDGAKFIIQDRYKYKPVERWHDCVKLFLNTMKPFDGTYVINYLSTAGGLKGPYKNAEYINPKFLDYNLDDNNYYGIIYLDFPHKEITQKIINTNF